MNMTRRYAFGFVFLYACLVASTSWLAAAEKATISAEKEKELIAILRSDAPKGDKAIACKQLAIDGSDAAVPELAKLLADEQLASWARTALEVIPGDAANEALRTAATSLEGRLLVGTINSLGFRRDAKAVELLSKRLQDKEPEVASAAAVALGQIGDEAAAKTLRAALAGSPVKVRSAVAEGCVLCAERLHNAGKSADAVAIYDEVRKAEVPKQRVIEATRGAILASKEEGLPLLLEQLRSPDKLMFQLGLGTAREFPGTAIDKALAEELTKAAPERAALIIQAMADRQDTVSIPAILAAAEKGPKPLRLSAVQALARVGDASCLAALLEVAVDADAQLAAAAKTTLADLQGDKINAQIASQLQTAKGKSYPLLIELVGKRRIEATPALLKALDSSDKAVRSAALAALGETVTLKELPTLVAQAIAPKHAEDAAAAQQALKAASVRMPDQDAAAGELAAALDKAPAATKVLLLETLAEVGGAKALKTVGAAAKSDNAQLQDDGSRLLGKWNSVDAAPVLLDLAKTGPAAQYRTRALRGYIGLARKFAMPDADRAAMCAAAMEQSKAAAEQKLVLDVLKLHPSKEGLALAIKAQQNAAVKEDASQATLVIAQKLGTKGVDVSEQLAKAGLEKVKLEIVKAEYGSGSTQKDVTEILRKQAGDLPLVNLAAGGYNANFGGDPLPGSVKQLKILYKINGKQGEATFAEDALIVLPTPKS